MAKKLALALVALFTLSMVMVSCDNNEPEPLEPVDNGYVQPY